MQMDIFRLNVSDMSIESEIRLHLAATFSDDQSIDQNMLIVASSIISIGELRQLAGASKMVKMKSDDDSMGL